MGAGRDKKIHTEIHALEMTFLTTKKDLNNPGPTGQEQLRINRLGAKPIEGTDR